MYVTLHILNSQVKLLKPFTYVNTLGLRITLYLVLVMESFEKILSEKGYLSEELWVLRWRQHY